MGMTMGAAMPSILTIRIGSIERSSSRHPRARFNREGYGAIHLFLSRRIGIVEEAARLMQMMAESECVCDTLLQVPDLRGALNKLWLLAQTSHPPKPFDPVLKDMCFDLAFKLLTDIEAVEQQRGESLVGLPSITDKFMDESLSAMLNEAIERKTRGNAFYRRGNSLRRRSASTTRPSWWWSTCRNAKNAPCVVTMSIDQTSRGMQCWRLGLRRE